MARSKICFKCEKRKSLSKFYTHPRMGDGHLNKCIECAKKDALEHRNANLDRIRAYDRERAKNPARAKMSAAVIKRWRQEDRRRAHCHNAVARALRNGTLEWQPCCKCGSLDSLAHHDDYSKPLEVRWFCQPHHKQWHKENDTCLKPATLNASR